MKRTVEPSPALAACYSRHARRRVRERSIPREAVEAALDWGKRVRGRNVVLQINDRAIRRAAAHGVDVRPYRGTVVVTTFNGRVITAYRRSRS